MPTRRVARANADLVNRQLAKDAKAAARELARYERLLGKVAEETGLDRVGVAARLTIFDGEPFDGWVAAGIRELGQLRKEAKAAAAEAKAKAQQSQRATAAAVAAATATAALQAGTALAHRRREGTHVLTRREVEEMAQDKNGRPTGGPQQDKNGRTASEPGLLNDLSPEGGRLHTISFAPSRSAAQDSSSSGGSSGDDEGLEGTCSGWVEWLLEGSGGGGGEGWGEGSGWEGTGQGRRERDNTHRGSSGRGGPTSGR